LGALPPMAEDPIAEAVELARGADAAVVVVGLNQDWETEGEDRQSMDLPGDQPALIRAVAAANSRTVVLVNAGSPVTMDWVDEVAACAQLWYLGQESGDAVADLLSGDHSPTAKLPTTFPVRYEDHPAIFNYPGSSGVVRYGEELFVGYRGYELRQLAPRFPFGHGLTYSCFELGAPSVDPVTFAAGDSVTVRVPVRNVGDARAAEVVQVYVSDPQCSVRRPHKELGGFAKVWLDPGEEGVAEVVLGPRAFRYWDPVAHTWVLEPGEFVLRIGTSSADIAHEVTITLEG
jgi:beta-glucosidase